MKNIIFLFLITISFSACSLTQKKVDTPTSQVQTEESFDDEFAEEFAEEKTEDFDPLNGYNRAMTTFNDKFYTHLAIPVAKGYRSVVHENIRIGIANVFDNLGFPVRFVNNLLQLKFHNSWEELQRFVLNSTFGLAGLIDVSKQNDLGLDKHEEDFGQTLAFYGVGDGFHLVLPFLGPSNLRDTFALAADYYISPLNKGDTTYYIPDTRVKSLGLVALKMTNETSFQPDLYETLKKDAIDLYPFLKEVYTKKREQEIKE